MEDYDAIVCPASSSPAIAHDAPEGLDFSYLSPYNLTGWPVVVVRCGTSSEGLPIDVQVVARPWREDVAFALALRIEQELGGWQPPAI
jgi:amidase